MRNVKIKGTNQRVQFPDSMSDDEMRAMLQREFSQPRTAEQNASAALTPIQSTAQSYEPSVQENMKQKIADFLVDNGIVSDRYGAQRIGDNLSEVLGMVPVAGDAQAGDDFGRSVAQGDAVGAALSGAAVFPVVGSPFSKGVRKLNDKLQAKIDSNWDAAFDEYSRLPDTDGGRLINTDEARELSPEYREDRTKAGEVHEASSNFTKQIYDRLLSEPTPEGREDVVRFMAGGAGAGKSTALKTGNAFNYSPDITYDTTLSKGPKDIKKIEKALQSGRNAEIIHVYRDPIDAFENGVITRGKNKDRPNGRIVPMAEVAKNHVGARESMQQVIDKYQNDNRVKIAIFDNSRGLNKGDFVDDINELPELKYTVGDLESEFKKILDRKLADGTIDQATYNQYLGK